MTAHWYHLCDAHFQGVIRSLLIQVNQSLRRIKIVVWVPRWKSSWKTFWRVWRLNQPELLASKIHVGRSREFCLQYSWCLLQGRGLCRQSHWKPRRHWKGERSSRLGHGYCSRAVLFPLRSVSQDLKDCRCDAQRKRGQHAILRDTLRWIITLSSPFAMCFFIIIWRSSID